MIKGQLTDTDRTEIVKYRLEKGVTSKSVWIRHRSSLV